MGNNRASVVVQVNRHFQLHAMFSHTFKNLVCIQLTLNILALGRECDRTCHRHLHYFTSLLWAHTEHNSRNTYYFMCMNN